MKTKWNLNLLYASLNDQKIKGDLASVETACRKFKKKYEGKSYIRNEKVLMNALIDWERIQCMKDPMSYVHYVGDLDGKNSKVSSLKNTIYQQLVSSSNEILFFPLSLGSLSNKQQASLLRNKLFKRYHYFLSRIFVKGKFQLSEAEEKILSLKSLPARSLWVQGQKKLQNTTNIQYLGKQISIGEASNRIPELPTQKRRELHKLMMETLKGISHFAESEINAIVTDKKINDELRGYKHPASGTIISYQNDEVAILNFANTITNHFSIGHHFFEIKKKMLNLPYLTYADRAARIGKTGEKLPFKSGVKIIQRAFEKVNPVYREIFDRYLENGQIDVYPKPGKTSGAYCSSDAERPTFVLLNYIDTLDSVMTTAHEMGHAIHAEFSKAQPHIYRGHSISTAEVASTLFENFAFEEIFNELSDKDKIVALHDRISDDIQTIFRQIACFNFETELHLRIRKEGSLPKEEISRLMNKHMASYLGRSFKFTDLDGYCFVSWPHIRNFFYVYSYAYGQLISKALYKKFKNDPSYLRNIEHFLRAGESKSPEQIFKDIGIDTSKPKFFIEGLLSIEEDIKRLEKLVLKTQKS